MKMFDATGSPGVIAFQDDFGIAIGKEAVSERPQLSAQLPVVVDTAIEDDTDAKFIIDQRLLRMLGKIDDSYNFV